MLDIKTIRQNPEILDNSMQRRGQKPISSKILDLDSRHRTLLTQLQELQTKRNTVAKMFGEAKQKGLDTAELSKEAEAIKTSIPQIESQADCLYQELSDYLNTLPNIVAEEVPDGKDETSNKVIKSHGKAVTLPFVAKTHFDLGEDLKMMDFEQASKMSGSRFVVLSSDLARLERALAAFMLDIHTQEFGYTEIYGPNLVNDQAMYGTGQLPKFKEDLFQTTNGYWLIPTAEVMLSNLVAGKVLSEDELPLRFTAYTQCFRSEAGAAGKDTRGMIRHHQFSKVELVSITAPEQSKAEHERMTSAAEEILKRLGLTYRVMMLCSGDIGFQSEKTYDLEVWLPSQNTYREISSCSNCSDFQARRMQARFKGATTEYKPQFVHTLNGSGLAVGRTLVAVLENYQNEDGSITIPDALIPYMHGKKRIEKAG